MSNRRPERMAIEMKRMIAKVLQEEVKDPRLDFSSISITRIEVTNDLSHAKISVSVLGEEEKQKAAMKALQSAKGYIRTKLSHSIQVRHFPELEFILDKSIEHGFRISSILKELEEKEGGKNLE